MRRQIAIIELLILPMAVALVMLFAAVHGYAAPLEEDLSLSSLAVGTL